MEQKKIMDSEKTKVEKMLSRDATSPHVQKKKSHAIRQISTKLTGIFKDGNKRSSSELDATPDPRNEGYDGYYDDVSPLDNGYEKEPMDSELIKRIIMIAGGSVLLIGLAIAAMFLL